MQPLIFVDMDGVLVDLWEGLEKRLNKKIDKSNKKEFTQEFYAFIENLKGPELSQFFATLPPTLDCFRIWNAVRHLKPLILSSVTNKEFTMYGKTIWCKNNLNLPGDRIFFSRKSNQKQYYASKFSILIDDFEDNIAEWRNAGGIAVHHVDTENTIRQIKKAIQELGFTY